MFFLFLFISFSIFSYILLSSAQLFCNIVKYCIVLEKLLNKPNLLRKPNTQEYCKPNTNTQYNRSGLLPAPLPLGFIHIFPLHRHLSHIHSTSTPYPLPPTSGFYTHIPTSQSPQPYSPNLMNNVLTTAIIFQKVLLMIDTISPGQIPFFM